MITNAKHEELFWAIVLGACMRGKYIPDFFENEIRVNSKRVPANFLPVLLIVSIAEYEYCYGDGKTES